MIAVYFSNECR